MHARQREPTNEAHGDDLVAMAYSVAVGTRWLRFGICAACAVTPAAGAEAAGDCVTIYDSAVAKKRQGKLLAARSQFAECTLPGCPAPVRQECTAQAQRLDRRIPSIVPTAVDSDGRELSDVSVHVKGRRLARRLDGRAHRLDPGPQTLQFRAPGRAAVKVRVVLAEGAKLRRVQAIFPVTDEEGDQRSAPIPTATYVLAGVAAVGLAGFAVFGLSGLSQESRLEECEPTCPEGDSDKLKRTYLFADISLVIGLASLGGATYFYVDSRGAEPAKRARPFAPPRLGRWVALEGVF